MYFLDRLLRAPAWVRGPGSCEPFNLDSQVLTALEQHSLGRCPGEAVEEAGLSGSRPANCCESTSQQPLPIEYPRDERGWPKADRVS